MKFYFIAFIMALILFISFFVYVQWEFAHDPVVIGMTNVLDSSNVARSNHIVRTNHIAGSSAKLK